MLRIKFYVVLFVMCLWVSGCAAFEASQNGLSTELIPSNVSAVQLLRTLGRGEITQIALSPNGAYMAVASSLGIWLYDAAPILTTMRIEQQPTPRLLAGHVGDVTAITFSADSTRLASGGVDNTVRVWDVATGNLIGAPMNHEGRVSGVSFSPNGALLASSSADNSVRLWDISQAALDGGTFGSVIGEPIRQESPLTSVAFSPTVNDDTLLLAAGNSDASIELWTLDMNGVVQGNLTRLSGFAGSVVSVAFSPDGLLLASGHQEINGSDNNVHMWDMSTREEIGVLEGHRSGIQSVSFSPNGRMVSSASSDGTVRLWNVATQNFILEMDDHAAPVSSAVISADNTLLLSAGSDGKVRIWGINIGGPLNVISGFGSDIISVAFSPDGSLIAAGTNDNAVHLWNVQSGNEVATLRGHRSAILAVAFNPDGTELASGSRDRTILLWNIEAALGAGEILPCDQTSIYRGLSAVAQQNHPCNTVRQLTGHNNDVRSLAFSADGYLLASGGCAQIAVRQCQEGEVRLWDVDMPGEISLMLEHNNWVESVAFSPDGSRLASGSRDETINIWDVETGLLDTTLYGQQGWVESVAFSHDGFLLASGGGDENVLIWNLVNPDELPDVLVGHTEAVTDVVFSPNGRLIVSTSLDDHVRVWDVRSGILLGDLVGHIGDVNSVSFRADGSVFASGGADGTIRLWGIP